MSKKKKKPVVVNESIESETEIETSEVSIRREWNLQKKRMI